MATADVYATREDLYDYGLEPGALAHRGRLCASARAATDLFELDNHGLATDKPISFRAEEGGALPAPIVAGTTYYAIVVSDSTFKVAAAAAGAAIDLTSNGEAVLAITELPIEKTLERFSRFVDGFIPHLVPLAGPPYPPVIVAAVAELAATKLLQLNNQQSDRHDRAMVNAKAELERYAKGVPVRDARAGSSSNLAYSESVVDSRGWGAGGRTIP